MSDLVEMDYRSVERAKRAKPLPLDASWSTGDEDFDARIHASLMQRDELLAALKALASFPGVMDLLADPNSLGSIRAQVDAAISHAEGRR